MRIATRKLTLPLAVLALGLGACDDPTELGGHVDAEGLALMAEGSEIYRYMLDDGPVPPGLTLALGVHEVAIVLLDHDGDPIPHGDEEGEEEELEVTVVNPAVLTWTPEPETGEAHEFLEFHGELEALQTGETGMSICLLHEGHCDFEANNITVTVTE